MAIISEVILEEITRRYAEPETVTPTPTPIAGPPEVTLVSFNAAWNGVQVDINWSTTMEINNAAFNLFRSSDAQTWVQIHSEPSKLACGNFTVTEPEVYAYTDTLVTLGATYYYRMQYSGDLCGGSLRMSDQTTSAAPQASIPGDIAIAAGATDISLSWTHVAPNTGYDVWRSTMPYFSPGQGGSIQLADLPAPADGEPVSFTDVGAAADSQDYFYLVMAVLDPASSVAAHLGKFSFDVTPGE